MIEWKSYKPSEVVSKENYYSDLEGNKLILREHPITKNLEGINVNDLDQLREDWVSLLCKELYNTFGITEIADKLFDLLSRFPPIHNWLKLPADTRPGVNISNMAQHLLLTSAFACSIARAWIASGRSAGELVKFVKQGKAKEPEPEELIGFIRIASMMHDIGKHPPQKHHERGKELIKRIFATLLDEAIVEELSNVAYRHHSGYWYQKRGLSPLGPLEELIAHADTLASSSDRPIPEEKGYNPFDEVEKFLERYLGDSKALCLILADTDRIKSYVFESAKLPEVRGGSLILTELNQKKLPKLLKEKFLLPPECLIYAAGGRALIVAPTILAKEIIQEIEKLYLETTLTATITCIFRPCLPSQLAKGIKGKANFGELINWMEYELRRKKDEKAFWPFFELVPYIRRCDSCELRPAMIPLLPFQIAEEGWLCEPCYRKRRRGREERTYFIKRFVEYTNKESLPSAKTLEEIGRAASNKAHGYIGVIYADGNNLGSYLSECKTPAEYKTFSQEVLHTTEKAVYEALRGFPLQKEVICSDGKKRKIHAFEIVSIGGDDVFLIVPGDMAIEIAIKICEIFESNFNKKLTMSAGVLIMPDHFPIYRAREIVEALLKSAKQKGRKSKVNETIPSFIDFQVITGETSLSEDISSKEVYTHSNFFENYILTERPYSLNILKEIVNIAVWIRKNFPISQLYLLRQALSEYTPQFARNWYRYQITRDPDRWGQLHTMLIALFGSEFEREFPWKYDQVERKWFTPMIDLVEIVNYVHTD